MLKYIWFFLKVPKYIRGVYFRILILLSGGKCGKNLMIERGVKFKHPFHAGIIFGDNVFIGRYTTIDIVKTGSLMLGNNISFTGFSYISSAKRVSIQQDVLIGEYVSIRDANHGMDKKQLIRKQQMEGEEIIIEQDVWVGRGAVILRGVHIESGSVIAANSVINNSYKPYSIIGGIPSKLLKTR